MKRRAAKQIGFLAVLGLAVWVVGPRALGQPAVQADVQTSASLTITGAVGAVYSIEYHADRGQTNGASVWRCLEFLRLPANPYRWTDRSGPVTGMRIYRAAVLAAPTNLVFLPPGNFRMGSPTNEVDRGTNEGPQTVATIRRGFWMGQYPVTQGEYMAVLGSNPSYFTTNNGFVQNLSRPVEQVNWSEATKYCRLLTERERAAGRIATNNVYRLATEAEWEYACRAGTSTRFSYGDDPAYRKLTDYAWYDANSGGTTHPVGQKLPNPWNLSEMHGHVFEWCQDLYHPSPGVIPLDPNRLVTGSPRVFRGGLWDGSAKYCRSAYRGHSNPEGRSRYIGFRIVLAPT